MSEYVEFIPKAGACLATKNVMSGAGVVRWMVREPSQAPVETPTGRKIPLEEQYIPPKFRQ
ncbi:MULTISPECIES: hypothetical protein [unclassified Brevibacterium]|uniref:hypothetical protein n=1 Tax=unclassified Brevibacterium TaxID=2614124 RepID=UPI0008A43883|nr:MULTISPECIES: hypothetical protein [unclassified Brevibacterium]OFS24830.1 hypothetical protein HMPREF3162_10575 [Brevibacterium sp. HMSC07C04]